MSSIPRDPISEAIREKQKYAREKFNELFDRKQKKQKREAFDEILEQIGICEEMCVGLTQKQITDLLSCDTIRQVSCRIRDIKYA